MDVEIPDPEVVRHAVDLACRAPSVHNSQPWQWTLTNDRLDLHIDPDRLLTTADTTGRQLVISCGAALHHLQVALTALRWSANIKRLPEGPHSPHLATIHFRHDARPRSHDFDLVTAMRHRYSDRRTFDPPGTGWNPDALSQIVHRCGAQLTVLPPGARSTLAAATELTAAARRYDSLYHTELHWWAGHCIPTEGIPRDALATADERARVGIGRSFPSGTDTHGADSTQIDQSTVVVLSTATDTRMDWLRCGEALSAVLLDATANKIATCPLTHLTEVPQSRARGFPPE
jgi:nitroreductase